VDSILEFSGTSDFSEAFRKDGYVIVPDVFSPVEIRKISQSFDRLQKAAASLNKTTLKDGTQFVVENQKILRIVWVAAHEPLLRDLGADKRITQNVGQLLGSASMDHLICQAHFKLPGDQVSFTWHQDAEHRGFGTEDWKDLNGTGSYVQTIVAIDPMTEENGPVMILPRSHRDGFLGLNQPGVRREKVVPEDRLVSVKMDPGSVMFFGPYLVHGSKPNNSQKPRRIFINGFAYPGANSRKYPGEGSGYRLTLDPSPDASDTFKGKPAIFS